MTIKSIGFNEHSLLGERNSFDSINGYPLNFSRSGHGKGC